MAEEKLTLNKVLNKLKNVAGFKDLSPNQMKTRLASLKQVAVKNALRLAKFKGAGAIAAFDIAMRLGPAQTGEGKGADPLNLFGPKNKNKVDKKAIEAAVKEANELDTSSKLAPDKSPRPKARKDKKVMRPKARPSNLNKKTKTQVRKKK